MQRQNLKAILLKKLQEQAISLEQEAVERLVLYVESLAKWNKVFRLTSVDGEESLLDAHIIDSLLVLPYVPDNAATLDVGTGPGLPGIVLAIVKPEISFTLLDSREKPIHFLRYVLTLLQMQNVSLVQSRVESYKPNHGFEVIVSRAVSEVSPLLDKTQHLATDDTSWLFMKGKEDKALAETLPANYTRNIEILRSSMPERTLVVVRSKK